MTAVRRGQILRPPMREDLPAELLRDVPWVCDGTLYAEPAAFARALRDHHRGREVPAWRPEMLVLPVPRVFVEFEAWAFEDIRPRLLLGADEPRGFTALELLFKVDRGIARALGEHGGTLADRCRFEGLALLQPSDPPVYVVDLGFTA